MPAVNMGAFRRAAWSGAHGAEGSRGAPGQAGSLDLKTQGREKWVSDHLPGPQLRMFSSCLSDSICPSLIL